MGVWGAAISALLGAILVAVQSSLDPLGVGGATVTFDEWVFIVNSILSIILVAFVPNLTGGANRVTKAVVHGSLMVTSAIVGYIIGGLSASEWINLLILFLTGAGVIAAKQPAFPDTNSTVIKPLSSSRVA